MPAARNRSHDDADQQNEKNQQRKRQLETFSEKADGYGIRVLRGKKENQRKQKDSDDEFDVPPDFGAYAV